MWGLTTKEPHDVGYMVTHAQLVRNMAVLSTNQPQRYNMCMFTKSGDLEEAGDTCKLWPGWINDPVGFDAMSSITKRRCKRAPKNKNSKGWSFNFDNVEERL